MPETYVQIKWPDGEPDTVYSPSSVVEDYFKADEDLEVSSFLSKCEEALNIASQKVYKKYGFACTSALSEIQRVKNKCSKIDATAKVQIIAIKR